MIFLIDYCTFPWWLAWLLLFLLGLLLGYLLWARFKGLLVQSESDLADCRKRGNKLEEELAECRKSYSSVDNENATLRGKIRELEADLKARIELTDEDVDVNVSNKGVSNLTVDEDSKGDSGDIDRPGVDTSDINVPDVDLSSNISADVPSVNIPEVDLSSNISANAPKVNVPDVNLSSNISADANITGAADATGSVKVGSDNMYSILKNDNLQVIEGIGPKMESVLKDNSVNNWKELAGKSSEEVKAILLSEKYGRKYQIIDPTSWPGQATLARDGQWDDLIGLQKSLDSGRAKGGGESDSKVEKLLIKAGVLRKFENNDLKVVEGIGPKISELMHNNGITTWAKMASCSSEKLQAILDGAGDRFKLADPGTWPKQAGMADAGQWKELDEYQDFLQGGKE